MIFLLLGSCSWSFLTLGLAGCKPTAPVAPPPAPKAVARSIGKPLTEEECLAYGKELTEAIRSGDAATFNRLIDWESVNNRCVAGIAAPEKYRNDFTKGLAQSEVSAQGIGGALVDTAKQGGTYTLLRSHTRDDSPWLLVRLVLPGSGVNYHDLPLARRPDGTIKALDIYVYLSGEPISQTFRRAYVQAVAGSNAGLIERLTGNDRVFAKNFKQMGEMGTACRAGKYEEALQIYNSLSPETKKDKTMLILRTQAALNLGKDDEYLRAIEDCRTMYPDDPSIDIMSIDYFFMKKRYQDALDAIDRLNKAVLGDPFLLTMKASVRAEQGDLAAARADLKSAMDAEPGLIDSYWNLINVSLKDNNYDETLKTLRTIRDQFQVNPGDLTTVDLYKGFIASPQYQEWLKENQAKAGGTDVEESKGRPKN